MLFENIGYANEHFESASGSILVEDSRITWIGEGRPAGYEGKVYNGKNKMLLPGFYNAHCHVPMTLLRGYGEGLPLDRWLNEKMFPFEAKLDPDAVYWGSLLGMAEMIGSGAVSFTEMYFFIDSIAKAADECGIKANIGHGMSAFSEDAGFRNTNAYAGTLALLDYLKGTSHDRILCDASLHAEYTSTPRAVRELAEFAKENGLRMHTHLSETAKEHEECKARRKGRTPARYFADCGVFDMPATAAHCVAVEDGDIEILLEKGVTAAHCPSSNLKLGSGVAPVWEMYRRGVNIAIGTDGAASNNNLNALEEVNLAILLQRGTRRDPLCMDMAAALKMASQNGAKSQGRMDCGCIKVGNKADLVVFDMDMPHLQPVFDPLSNVLFSAQSGDICMTMADGRILYQDGELLTIDIEKVIAECKRVQRKILGEL